MEALFVCSAELVCRASADGCKRARASVARRDLAIAPEPPNAASGCPRTLLLGNGEAGALRSALGTAWSTPSAAARGDSSRVGIHRARAVGGLRVGAPLRG